jgi:hypothetical protein
MSQRARIWVLVRLFAWVFFAAAACAPATASRGNPSVTHSASGAEATLAHVFYWRARPGKLEEYNRYVRDVAEPIDAEAQRLGAFISVTTLVARDTLSPWTHMRVFLLRDSTQLRGLSAALARAGERLEPDSARRRVRGQYSATLRDRVGDAVLEVLR